MRITEHRWKKSSYSDNDGNCVEASLAPAEIRVRDTKDREGGQLAIPAPAWTALLNQLGR